MSEGAAATRRAVLETSFWIGAHRAEVAANCFDYYELVVPRAVEAEIRAPDPDAPAREYPYATLFRLLRARLLDPPIPGPPALDRFGPGEAEAIPLARALGVQLLINEHRAARYAAALGIVVVTVPAFVVFLYERGVISQRAAQRKLDLIEPITAERLIVSAREALEQS